MLEDLLPVHMLISQLHRAKKEAQERFSPNNLTTGGLKGSNQNFTMFFQIKLVIKRVVDRKRRTCQNNNRLHTQPF